MTLLVLINKLYTYIMHMYVVQKFVNRSFLINVFHKMFKTLLYHVIILSI